MKRFGFLLLLSLVAIVNALGQPGGGGGVTIDFKGMDADSARLFLVENTGNPLWISQSNALPLNQNFTIHPVRNWNYNAASPLYRLVFYQGAKTMTIDIENMASENPVGFTPMFDSLLFFEGSWSWNTHPYWPKQEDIVKGYGVTNYTISTWEKCGFWKAEPIRKMEISPLYHFNQAMSFRRKREWNKASFSIEKAILQARTEEEKLIFNKERLILLVESEDWNQAHQAANDLLKKHPSDFMLNQHGLKLAIRFQNYTKADSCYQFIIRQEPSYYWDYLMFLSAYMQQGESAYLRGLQKLNEVKNVPWEGEPIGVASNCEQYFLMAKLAVMTKHVEEASRFAYEAANRGYGYNMSSLTEFEGWHNQYNEHPYFSLAYALNLHHATNYETENSLLERANQVLMQIDQKIKNSADYWWTKGLVNERLQDWEVVKESGRAILKFDKEDLRGHYLLFRFYAASTPAFHQKKSEEHRLKYAELKNSKLKN